MLVLLKPFRLFDYSGINHDIREHFENEFPGAPVSYIFEKLIDENNNTKYGNLLFNNSFSIFEKTQRGMLYFV